MEEFMNKEFYIIDCTNFIYFPRVVKVIGFEMTCGEEPQCVIDIPEYYNATINRKIYKDELERFKSFNEAKQYAEKLNNIPENKKRAEDWNSSENQYRMLLAEQEFRLGEHKL